MKLFTVKLFTKLPVGEPHETIQIPAPDAWAAMDKASVYVEKKYDEYMTVEITTRRGN